MSGSNTGENNTVNDRDVVVEVNLDDKILQSKTNDSFISEHQDEINKIKAQVMEVIKSSNITIDIQNIKVSEILRIVSSITKAINNIKELKQELEELPANDKAGILFSVTANIINSPEISQHLSPAVKDKILDFTENGEAVNEIASIVDWVGDKVLTGYDKNDDGIVTNLEIEEDCVGCCICSDRCGNDKNGCACYQTRGCCACCLSFSRAIARCWSTFFINILCCQCGKKQVRYSRD